MKNPQFRISRLVREKPQNPQRVVCDNSGPRREDSPTDFVGLRGYLVTVTVTSRVVLRALSRTNARRT